MAGFVWTTAGSSLPPGAPGDGWCVRDSVCGLFGWLSSSPEWLSFIECPQPDEVDRLVLHLGLVRVNPTIPHHFAWLVGNLRLPCISVYNFHSRQRSHFQHESSIGGYRGLPVVYRSLGDAELVEFLIDGRVISR
jgi:hypothetical protein